MTTLIHLQRDKTGPWDVTELISRGRQVVVKEVEGEFIHIITEKDNWHHYGACKDEHE